VSSEEAKNYRIRGGGMVTQTVLPRTVELDVTYPTRRCAAVTRLGTAWLAALPDCRTALVVDERMSGGQVTVFAFEDTVACLRVLQQILEAFRGDGRSLADSGDGGGGVPLPPVVPPTPREPRYEILPVPPIIWVPGPNEIQ
jgi:hypothetical protein